MITNIIQLIVGFVLAACVWWLANRVQLLLNHAEQLLADAARDRHPAGRREPEPAPTTAELVAGTDAQPVTVPDLPATEPTDAVIPDDFIDKWFQDHQAQLERDLADFRANHLGKPHATARKTKDAA